MKIVNKAVLTAFALALGIGFGFGAFTHSAGAPAGTQPRCSTNSECDAYCGEVGAGVCYAFHCYCSR